MDLYGSWRRWRDGWTALARHGEVAGYRELGTAARLRLDVAVLVAALRSGGFWRAAWICSALLLVAHILAWQHDLAGWRRDALHGLPLALVAPWVAAGRRRELERRPLPASSPVANSVTVPGARPLHSLRVGAAELWCWLRSFLARQSRQVAGASGAWTWRWRLRASVYWQRLRCRASRR